MSESTDPEAYASPPPGWYPYGNGVEAYWDGANWTNHTRPRATRDGRAPSSTSTSLRSPVAMITGVVAAALLLGALLPWPYAYYQFLRLVVTAAAVVLAVLASRSRQAGWIVFGVVAAIVFNPLIPVTANRGFWAPIDVSGAVLFTLAGFRIRGHPRGASPKE